MLLISEDMNSHIKEFRNKETSLRFEIKTGVKGKYGNKVHHHLKIEYWELHFSEEEGEGINLVTKIISYNKVKGVYNRLISYDRTPVYKKWYPSDFNKFKF